jgi:hypothetical protein
VPCGRRPHRACPRSKLWISPRRSLLALRHDLDGATCPTSLLRRTHSPQSLGTAGQQIRLAATTSPRESQRVSAPFRRGGSVLSRDHSGVDLAGWLPRPLSEGSQNKVSAGDDRESHGSNIPKNAEWSWFSLKRCQAPRSGIRRVWRFLVYASSTSTVDESRDRCRSRLGQWSEVETRRISAMLQA